MAYCDTTFADTYLSAGAFAGSWTGTNKAKYLETATRFIKQYCWFYDEETDEPFRYDENDSTLTIPDWLKQATCEEALYLITLDKDPSAADKKTTLGIQSTDGTIFSKMFSADILGKSCIAILENNGGIISSDATVESSIDWGYYTK